ncbi:hypothetical protein ACFWYW_34710 [Nonomuraea sp. NPDC059023]|uniref:hypothetical protein n=1 Tax=unclassified Nonomuraea TaxID=2593643 RepID=UPI0036B86977
MRSSSRKRRRTRSTPSSDWQLPLLSDMGLRPEQQRLLVIIGSALGVVVLAVGLVAVIGSLGTGYLPDRAATAAAGGPGTARPDSFHGWSSPKLFEPISERAKDAKPLTEKELFAGKTLADEKKLTLKLVAHELGADCAAVLWGPSLVEKAADGECTQAARALYTSSDGRYVAQYTLLNLRDAKAADELVTELKAGYRGGWTHALQSEKASFPGGGYTEGGAYALGHYLGVVWIGRADGAEPTPKDDFVSATLTLRGAEKAVYRRVVAITGQQPS